MYENDLKHETYVMFNKTFNTHDDHIMHNARTADTSSKKYEWFIYFLREAQEKSITEDRESVARSKDFVHMQMHNIENIHGIKSKHVARTRECRSKSNHLTEKLIRITEKMKLAWVK